MKILRRIFPILTFMYVSYNQFISKRLHSLVQTQCYFWLAAVTSLFSNSEFEAKLYWSKSQTFLNHKKFHFQAKWKKFQDKLQYTLWDIGWSSLWKTLLSIPYWEEMISEGTKGQLVSEWIFEVLNFPQKQCKNLMNFCSRI